MPWLDIDLYRNSHTHTRNRGKRTHYYTHACIDTLAQVYLYSHGPHIQSHTCTRTQTHAHMCSNTRTPTHAQPTQRGRSVHLWEGDVTRDPSNKYGFTWSKHKKINVTNSRGSRPSIVGKLRQNVLLKSSRTRPRGVKVWHNVKSLSSSISTAHWNVQ